MFSFSKKIVSESKKGYFHCRKVIAFLTKASYLLFFWQLHWQVRVQCTRFSLDKLHGPLFSEFWFKGWGWCNMTSFLYSQPNIEPWECKNEEEKRDRKKKKMKERADINTCCLVPCPPFSLMETVSNLFHNCIESSGLTLRPFLKFTMPLTCRRMRHLRKCPSSSHNLFPLG